jgi:hypothetical protein
MDLNVERQDDITRRTAGRRRRGQRGTCTLRPQLLSVSIDPWRKNLSPRKRGWIWRPSVYHAWLRRSRVTTLDRYPEIGGIGCPARPVARPYVLFSFPFTAPSGLATRSPPPGPTQGKSGQGHARGRFYLPAGNFGRLEAHRAQELRKLDQQHVSALQSFNRFRDN